MHDHASCPNHVNVRCYPPLWGNIAETLKSVEGPGSFGILYACRSVGSRGLGIESMTAMAQEALTLNWAGVETPWAERLIVGIVVTMLAGLYGAVGGKRTRRGSLLLLSCLVVALNARYFVWNMHDAIGFFIALYDPFIHVGLDSGGASAFLLSVLG